MVASLIANPDTVTRDLDSPVTIPIANLLSNDFAATGTPVFAGVAAYSANGAHLLVSGGFITYQPLPGSNTTDTFTYTITNNSLTATGLVTVLVVPFLGLDIMAPGDPIQGTSANSPANQFPAQAIDNTASSKYLNLDITNTGFTVTPSGHRVVRALTLISAEDAPERSPASFLLEGSLDGTNFTFIASNTVPPFPTTNFIQSLHFGNSLVYPTYRLRFPNVANALTANSMQIAEVELLPYGEITSSNDSVSLTLPTGAVDVRGVACLFDRQLGLTNKFEIASITNGFTVVDLIPAAGATVLKGIELIGGEDDATYPYRVPSSVTVAGSVDGANFTVLGTMIPTAPTTNLAIQELAIFANNTSYLRYRLIFGPRWLWTGCKWANCASSAPCPRR